MNRRHLLASVLALVVSFPALASPTTPPNAPEKSHYILRAEVATTRLVDGKDSLRKAAPTLMLRGGEQATFALTPSKDATYEVRSRYTVNPKGPGKIRLDFEISTRVSAPSPGSEAPWQTSQVSSTILEGETWETTLEEPRRGCHTKIVVTVWTVPDGHKFVRFDSQHKPVFGKK